MRASGGPSRNHREGPLDWAGSPLPEPMTQKMSHGVYAKLAFRFVLVLGAEENICDF